MMDIQAERWYLLLENEQTSDLNVTVGLLFVLFWFYPIFV